MATRWAPTLNRCGPPAALILSTAGGIGLSRGDRWPFWTGAAAVLIALALQVLQGALSVRKVNLDRDAEAQLFDSVVAQQDLMSDLLGEVARSVASMTRRPKSERATHFLRLAQQVVDAARAAYREVTGLRCVIYSLDDAGTSLHPQVFATVGHREHPKPLLARTERGDQAVQLVHAGGHMFVESIKDAPNQWKGSGVGYDTFLSIPIRSSNTAYGLLTVDAPNTGDITPAIVATWRLAASVMATAFAVRNG